MLRCFDTAVILLGSHKLAESTSEVVSIVSPPLLYQNHRACCVHAPCPPSMQWESVYQHLNGIHAAVKLFQLETVVRQGHL